MSDEVMWRLVPVEPTEDMLSVTVTRDDGRTTYDYSEAGILQAARRDIWTAMLAAAPPPPDALVEKWARMIDPGAFGFCHIRGGKVVDDWADVDPLRHEAALSKARELIATVTGEGR